MRRFDVVVVSGAGIDTNVYLSGKDIDFNVEANFTEDIDYVGQAGGYSSRGFARLGKRTALIDIVGEDYHGDFVLRTLQEDGIDTQGVVRHTAGTRRSVNFMYADGSRKNFYDGKGAMKQHLDIADGRRILSQTRLAHFNVINFSRDLLPVARKLGITISCDVQDLVSADDPYRQDYIHYADILFFSAVNHDDPQPLMEGFLQRNPHLIIVTGMGLRGCGVGTKDGVRFFPPVQAFGPVVDTNGAGDALAVGFLTSYVLDGHSLEDAVLRGQIAARFTCTLRGTSSGLITLEQLDKTFAMFRAG